MTRLIILLGLLLISSLASAEIYKWVDAQGQVHYQDHPQGAPEKFSTDEGAASHTGKPAERQPDTGKLLKDMEKSRKQQDTARHKKLAEQRKQDEKCIKYRYQTDRLEARMKKRFSQFSNDRPAEYARQQKQLAERKKYLDKYCN